MIIYNSFYLFSQNPLAAAGGETNEGFVSVPVRFVKCAATAEPCDMAWSSAVARQM